MSETTCPVCNSQNHHSFWFWEKEDKLIRMWAMDTRVSFSICRDCSTIFQNPLVPSPSSDEFNFTDWGEQSDIEATPKEAIEWLRQFVRRGKEPLRALEVYSHQSRFKETLSAEGWDIIALPVSSVLSEPDGETNGAPPLLEEEPFDIVFCFDVLEKISNPTILLGLLHERLKPDGGLYIETFNPYVAPRKNQICLTSDHLCIFSFQSLIYSLNKLGFTNQTAETCGNFRCYCTKNNPNPDADAKKMVPNNYWSHLLFRFERNYQWAWVSLFMEKYMREAQSQPDALDRTRTLLRQKPEDLSWIRDVCGAVLLFVQEVDTLRQTLNRDWSGTMQRIFEILTHDYALFDLLHTGAPMQDFGILPPIGRYYFNEKMIFMTERDYFERFFTQEEAARLSESIVRSGEVVCKTLSSFL